MVQIAINVLWFLVGLIILAGIVYLALWVIRQFVYPIPVRVEQGIWVIVLLLALIALLTAIMGGGSPRFPRLGESGTAFAAFPTEAAGYLSRLLG